MAGQTDSRPTSLALGLYALLIAFGSLYTSAGFLGLGAWSLDFLLQPPPRYLTRTDISTNLLAYMPLGYLLARRLAQRRGRGAAILLATLAGAGFSLCMESLQTPLLDRIASNIDAGLNALGSLLGALLTLHHQRWRRAGRRLRRWRRDWFAPTPGAGLVLGLLGLWALTQFALVPMPGAGWLGLHLRPLDSLPSDARPFNPLWFAAVLLEMMALGAFMASWLKPGRYVTAMLLLFLAAFAVKLLAATLLLKLRAVGGVLSLETLAAFLLAFWFLLIPFVSRQRRPIAALLLLAVLALRAFQADYLLWPIASVFNIVGLAKAAASFWLYLALGVLGADVLSRARRHSGRP